MGVVSDLGHLGHLGKGRNKKNLIVRLMGGRINGLQYANKYYIRFQEYLVKMSSCAAKFDA